MPSPLHRTRSIVLFYGTLLLFAGLLTGLPFAMSIRYEWGDDVVRAWRVAHTSMVTGGLLYLGIAGTLDGYALSPRTLKTLQRSLIVAAIALLVVLPVGAMTGERGLRLGDSVIGTLVALGFLVMGAAVFHAVGLLVVGAYRALREPREG